MIRKYFFAALALTLLAGASASAQSTLDEHRLEIGAVFTAINLDGFEETAKGVGGRFAYNINDNFAVDAEASIMPRRSFGNRQFSDRAQAFLGVRAGARTERVGLFAKARPGLMSLSEVTSGFDCDDTDFGQTCRPSHSQFAFDVGGVLEVYPSSRTIIRVDVGDTIVRIKTATPGFFSSPQSASSITHNFQASIGFGYRF